MTVALGLMLEDRVARYVTVDADLGGTIVPATLGSAYEDLRRRRIVIDAPPQY